jgi:VanZ family protein
MAEQRELKPAPSESLPPGAISDEPLINIFHRMVVEIILAAYAAALLYVSFVPFDFTQHPRHALGRQFLGLAFAPFGLPDILANLAVYVPLGALGFAVLRRWGLGRIISGAIVIALGGLLSFAIEWSQQWVASRVSSWVDVTANVLGCGLGAAIVAIGEPQIRRIVERAKWAARRNWWLTLSKASVCAVLVLQLRPYDVVTDPFHTAAALRHADVSPLAQWRGIPTEVSTLVQKGRLFGIHALARLQWEYCIDRAVDVAAYALVVALVVLGMAPRFRSKALLYLWAGFIGVSLAAMVTVIRIFLISRGLDTAHFFCGVLAWPIGCLLGGAILRSNAKARAKTLELQREDLEASGRSATKPPRGMAAWQKLAIGFALLMVAAYELAPFDIAFDFKDGRPTMAHGIVWMPFEAHFHSKPNVAFYDISGDFLRYGIAGLCLAMLAANNASRSWRRQLCIVVAAIGAVCIAFEGLHIFMPTHHADTTTLLLALAGAMASTIGLRWVADYRKSLPVFMAEDLLTSQLIEGETYKALPTVSAKAASK